MYFHARRGVLGSWTVIHVVGEIDLATAPQYRAELTRATGDGALLVDLRDCDLIDSVGLGITIGAARRQRAAGQRFAVVASSAVRRSFEQSRLDEIIDVVADPESLAA